MDWGHRQRQGVMLEMVGDVQKKSSIHVRYAHLHSCVCRHERASKQVRERERDRDNK